MTGDGADELPPTAELTVVLVVDGLAVDALADVLVVAEPVRVAEVEVDPGARVDELCAARPKEAAKSAAAPAAAERTRVRRGRDRRDEGVLATMVSPFGMGGGPTRRVPRRSRCRWAQYHHEADRRRGPGACR